eukprot:6152534-Karenia_brevis.AAC.1
MSADGLTTQPRCVLGLFDCLHVFSFRTAIPMQRKHSGTYGLDVITVRAAIGIGIHEAQGSTGCRTSGVRGLDLISFNTAISACEKDGPWEQVVAGCGFDVNSFKAAISACDRAEQLKQVVAACGLDVI